MVRCNSMSTRTRINWLLDFVVFLGGILAVITGIYFLFLPVGGFQGGRNPTYGLQIIFERGTWDDLHTWGGVLMIVAALVHFVYHWPWVRMMAKRMLSGLRSREARMSLGAKFNLVVDALLASSFFTTAVSGVYLLLAPLRALRGGTNLVLDSGAGLGDATWDLIHTWAGVVMIVTAVIHFAIHWRWITKVTRRFFLSLSPQVVRGNLTEAEPV
jgi:hypothetical protein